MGSLSVVQPLAELVPGGALKRGTTLQISGHTGVTSLGLAVASASAQAGSWVAVMGHRSLGLAAALELGLPPQRLVLVANPERRLWATAAAALVDAFDLVLVFSEWNVSARDSRRLAARARERSTVLVRLGPAAWPEPADLRLDIEACEWHGLGMGHGALRARLLSLVVSGRRAASRPRRARLWLPDPDGQIRLDTAMPFGETAPFGEPAPFRGTAPFGEPALGEEAGDRAVLGAAV